MNLPLPVLDGKFIARCSLLGSPNQDLLGVIDTGSTVTGVDVQTCRRAGLKFAGESDRVRCVHRGHREVVRSYLGHIVICGRTEYTTVYELDMGPESVETGINAILGWDVLGDLKITLDRPRSAGTMEISAGA